MRRSQTRPERARLLLIDPKDDVREVCSLAFFENQAYLDMAALPPETW